MRFLAGCFAGSCWVEEGGTLILHCSVHMQVWSFIPRQCSVWSVTWGMHVSVGLSLNAPVSYTPLSPVLLLRCLATDPFFMLPSTHLHPTLHSIRTEAARTWGLLGFGRECSLPPKIGIKFILGYEKPSSGHRNAVSFVSHFKWEKLKKKVWC